MNQIFSCMVLLLSLSGSFSKYVYIDDKKHWDKAQEYCQQHYTDLAPVSNEYDILKLRELGNVNDKIWIGLERNSLDKDKWLWSGGGEVTKVFWEKGQPDNNHNDKYGYIHKNRWHDTSRNGKRHFFCYRAVVVREKKTWEEALEYCREHYDDLASVASETEMLLIHSELNKHNTTENVWIGLHFFSGDWLWVDRQEMDYEAWNHEAKPSCPHAKMECVALEVKRLSKGVWGAQDCEEKLNFICY